MNAQQKSDSNPCFICGPANAHGMQLKFSLQSGRCTGNLEFERKFSGWEGFVHGGMLYSVLDDVMANWLFLNGEQALTARADVRYRNALPVAVRVCAESWEEGRRRNLVQMAGRIMRLDSGLLIAEARATFMLGSPSA